MTRRFNGWMWLAFVAACGPDQSALESTSAGVVLSAEVSSSSAELRSPTPVAPAALLSVVKVFTGRGMCTGTVIARDRVLMAAHCACTEDLIGSNACDPQAAVAFRPNPATGTGVPNVAGTVTWHPSYNPSWVDKELENDLAIVTLASDAPSYVTPMLVATAKPPAGSSVMLVGFGRTGGSCSGSPGTLNFQVARFDRTVDEGRQIQFDNPVLCPGDSGGPVLNTSGTAVYAVNSSGPPTAIYGWVSKCVLTAPYSSWIKGETCSSQLSTRCSDKAPMCRCSAGIGDCDTNADCLPSLHCAQNVGASFGYPSTIDVCVTADGGGAAGSGCPIGSVCCEPTQNGCSVCRPANGVCP